MLKPKRPGDVLQINCIARMGQIAFKIMRQQPLPECECRGASGLLGKGCTEQLVRGRFHNYEGVQCLCPVPHNGMTTLPDTWGWFEYVVLSKDLSDVRWWRALFLNLVSLDYVIIIAIIVAPEELPSRS